MAAVFRDTQNYIRSSAEGLGLCELPKADISDLVQWKRLMGWLEADNPVLKLDQPSMHQQAPIGRLRARVLQ